METIEEVDAQISKMDWRDDGAFIFHHPPKYAWPSEQFIPDELKWKELSLYVHVPFCRKICTFCTFERQIVSRRQIAAFTQTLLREIGLYRQISQLPKQGISSVYLGGGTASLLPNECVAAILDEFVALYGLTLEEEVTLECEPGTKARDDFSQVRKSGVNRISVGVQAFQDRLLKQLGRAHDVSTSVDTVQYAKRAGFRNVHIDLIYGLPTQTLGEWKQTLEEALRLDVQHVSCYPLIVFENEQLQRELRKNGIQECDRELREDMRQYTLERLGDHGFQQYSLTEFSKPGFECKYVKSNWNGSDYLGFGPGAYSRQGLHLWEAELFHKRYHGRVAKDEVPVGRCRNMTKVEQLERDIAMGLCLLKVDVKLLANGCEDVFTGRFSRTIDKLLRAGLLWQAGNLLYLTDQGKRYATQVMKTLVAKQKEN